MRAGMRNTVVVPYAKTESPAPKADPHPERVRINGLPLVAGGREEAVQTSAIEVDEASAVFPQVGLYPVAAT